MRYSFLACLLSALLSLCSANAFCAAAWDASTDDAMLISIERAAFNFLWDNVNLANGSFTVSERQANFSGSYRPYTPFYSVTAAGFGLVAVCVAHKNGWISLADAKSRLDAILTQHLNAPESGGTALSGGLVHHNGFFYHFTKADGTRDNSGTELSAIDTGWFVAGALFAGQYIKDVDSTTALWDKAVAIYTRVDWQWMQTGATNSRLRMAWTPESGFAGEISGYSEGILCYILGRGAPDVNKKILENTGWDSLIAPVIDYRGLSYIYDGNGNALFVHQYPGLFIDFSGRKTAKYASFALNTYNATVHNHRYAYDNSASYSTYGADSWGLSATDVAGVGSWDGLWGLAYKAYDTSDNDGTVCLSSLMAAITELPGAVKAAARYLHDTYAPDIWGNYGFPDSYKKDFGHAGEASTCKTWGWVNPHVISHQQGSGLLAIENYRSGFVKATFTNISYIQDGLSALGFSSNMVKPGKLAGITTGLSLNPGKTSALLNLNWMASGADNSSVDISSGVYEIRYSTTPADTWETAPLNYLAYDTVWSTAVSAGAAQNRQLAGGFSADTTYYMWLRLADDHFNWSLPSDTITFRAGITALVPAIKYNTDANADIIFYGDSFDPGTTIKLTKQGEADISPNSFAIISSTKIAAAFDLSGKTSGYWTPIANLGGSSIMVSTFSNGLLLAGQPDLAPADLSLLEIYPIPFKPNDSDTDNGVAYSASDPSSGIIFDRLPSSVSVKIYTLTGQLAAHFGSVNSSGKLRWNVKTDDGRDAASGGYLAVVLSPGCKAVVRKIMVVR